MQDCFYNEICSNRLNVNLVICKVGWWFIEPSYDILTLKNPSFHTDAKRIQSLRVTQVFINFWVIISGIRGFQFSTEDLIIYFMCLLLHYSCYRFIFYYIASGTNDKQPTDDLNHHIQAEENEYEYVTMPHKNPKTNGCITPNHITIRSNPLADADNKVRSIDFKYKYFLSSNHFSSHYSKHEHYRAILFNSFVTIPNNSMLYFRF